MPGPNDRLLVSVVVPCKNEARYLPQALESILSQDYPNIECIVADGGSTDGTIELLKRYGERICWMSEPDRGAFDAINRGMKQSKGDILAWLNADDLWEPGAVRTVVEIFEDRHDVDVVYGSAGVVDELGRFLGDLVPGTWDLEYALRHCHHLIFQPASFIRRRILEKVGWLYPAWCHDHDLWLRIARGGGTFVRLPTRLAMDRMRPDNLGRLAEVVAPAKIGLTKRFFAEPGLPPNIESLRQRAISSAHVRAVDYLRISQPRQWLTAVRLLVQALIADPRNIGSVLERATRPFRWRIAWLFNESLGVFSGPRRWVGRGVERVFARGNRGLRLEIEGLHRRMPAIQQQVAAAVLQPMAKQIDGIAADVLRLADRIDGDRHAVADVLDALRLEHELLRKELRAAKERSTARLSDALHEVYGTPPTLRPIPGWHTYWNVEGRSDRLIQGRVDLWSSMKRPVLMRWFSDLLVMIWPGNELSQVLFLTGNFEPNELTWVSQTLAEGMTVIDVGAHMGLYSAIASRFVGKSGLVIALEPSTREFQRLAFHVTLNELQNVRCVQAAASDFSGEATLKIAWEWNSGHNTFGDFFSPAVELARKEVVRTQTLDALVAAEGLERVDLIKIDVEGHELKALAGAVETLTRFRPRVLIEVFEQTLRRQGAAEDEVLAFFRRHRYVLNEFSSVTGELVPLSRTTSDQSRNIVALPV